MKVLLIDLENCPSQINELLENLANYSQVVICYAQSGAKIPIDWILPLTKVVNDDHLKIIKMPIIGKNAADFGITFWAGVLMAQLGEQTHFDIISNDADLDYVVELLNTENRTALRIGKLRKEDIIVEPVKTLTVDKTISPIQIYCSHLAKYPNKPAKQTTLLNSIKSKFQDTVIPEKLLADLVKQKVITVTNEKISYNLQKINIFKTQD
jgi:hypothetical protein